jgi:hypothetical protein
MYKMATTLKPIVRLETLAARTNTHPLMKTQKRDPRRPALMRTNDGKPI